VLSRKSYRYRVYPTEEQKQRLRSWEGALRFLWNLALEQRLMGLGHAKGEQKFYTAFDQINELTALRAEVEWLADVPRNVCAQVLVELDKAWQRCFKKLGKKPRFKRRGRDSMGLCEPHAKVFRIEGDAILFPKLGALKMVPHRPLLGKAKTCTIKRDVDQWFVCISCEREVDEPAASTLPAVGLDRGVMMLLADSEGGLVPNPGHGEQMAARMANAQRAVTRKQKGSQNQRKARVRVARLQRKVRRQREHTLHTLSHRYAKNHGVVVVEDLQIKNMTASAKGTVEEPGSNVPQKAGLNRRILDAGWGKFVELLSGKLAAVGGLLVKVPAAYSSQTCAACGVVDTASRMTQASFVCTGCGHHDHADSNAAKVILSRRTGGGDVCGGDSVARPVRQKLRVARRGTVVHGGAVKSPAVHGGDGLRTSLPHEGGERGHRAGRGHLGPREGGRRRRKGRRGRGRKQDAVAARVGVRADLRDGEAEVVFEVGEIDPAAHAHPPHAAQRLPEGAHVGVVRLGRAAAEARGLAEVEVHRSPHDVPTAAAASIGDDLAGRGAAEGVEPILLGAGAPAGHQAQANALGRQKLAQAREAFLHLGRQRSEDVGSHSRGSLAQPPPCYARPVMATRFRPSKRSDSFSTSEKIGLLLSGIGVLISAFSLRQPKAPPAPPARIVDPGDHVLLFGDSIAEGIGPPLAHLFADNGVTFAVVAHRGDSVRALSQKASHDLSAFKVVLLSAGSNDLGQATLEAPALGHLLAVLRQQGALVMWVVPPSFHFEGLTAAQGQVVKLFQEAGVPLVPIKGPPVDTSFDGVHTDPAGYRQLAAQIYDALITPGRFVPA